MARPRTELSVILRSILESDNVYFQPPTNFKLQYPCIVYKRTDSRSLNANNNLYRNTKQYQVTVIDRNPDTEIADKIEALPLCRFTRGFAAEDLNHYVFNLYF